MTTAENADTGHNQAPTQAAHARIFPGVSVFARAEFDSEAAAKAAFALGNVVPFQRARQESLRQAASKMDVVSSERPAEPIAAFGDWRRNVLVVAVSLLAHAAVFAAFNRSASPKASIGVEVITVELVLGSDVNAGLAAMPSRSEEAQNSAAAEVNSEQQPEATEPPASEPEPVAKPAVTIAESPQVTREEPKPLPERAPERPRPQTAEPKPKQNTPAPKPQPRREKKTTPSPVNSAPSMASSGIGRGRSDANTNYRGLVAAHLARHKQFPPDARRLGDQGSAVITFKIDGAGRVVSARLTRPIGIDSLDREAVAMVHRASPFPAPPNARPQSFTVPVSFQLSKR